MTDQTPTEPAPDAPFSPLVGAIFTQMFADSASTSTRLIDSLTEQLAEANATLDAIRDRIEALLDGSYMPTSTVLRQALWPPKEIRECYRQVPQ